MPWRGRAKKKFQEKRSDVAMEKRSRGRRRGRGGKSRKRKRRIIIEEKRQKEPRGLISVFTLCTERHENAPGIGRKREKEVTPSKKGARRGEKGETKTMICAN